MAPQNDTIHVIDPSGNVLGYSSNYKDALLSQGYKLATDEQVARARQVAEKDSAWGAAQAFAGGATKTFGVSPLIEKFAPGVKRELDIAQEANPTASAIGSVTGIAGLAAGPIGKAATAAGAKVFGAAAPIVGETAAGLAKYGAEGVVGMLPAAASQAATGDIKEAAETVVYNGLIQGAIFGKTLEAGASLFKGKVGSFVGSKADEILENQKLKALGANKSVVNKLDADEKKLAIQVAEEKGWLNTLGSILKTPGNKAQELEAFKNEAGSIKGKLMDAIDASPNDIVDKGALAESFKDIAGSIPKRRVFRRERAAVSQAASDVLDMAASDSPIKMRELEELRLKFASEAKYESTHSDPVKRLYKKMERTLDDHMAKTVESAEPLIDNVSKADWNRFKREYKAAKVLEPMFDNAVNMGANQALSLSTYGSMTVGGMVAGPIGAAKAFIMDQLRKQYGAQAGSFFLDKAIKGTRNITKFVDDGATRALGTTNPIVATTGILRAISGKEDKSEAVDAVRDNLAQMVSSPGVLAERLGGSINEIASEHPELAIAAHTKTFEVVKKLLELAPTRATPSGPFDNTKHTYTGAQVSDFERQIATAINPLSILDDLAENKVDPGSMAILREAYPQLYGRLQTAVLEKATEKKGQTYSYGKKLNLSLFFGKEVDSMGAPENLQFLQQSFVKKEEAGGKIKAPGGKAYATKSQDIENR